MRGPEGGFYSALDADSEGVEGRFYVWTLAELREALGEDADAAIAWLGASERGQLRGPAPPAAGAERAPDRGPRPARQRARDARAHPRAPARGARTARAPRARRQAADELERADDRRARRRRSGARRSPRYLEAAIACAEFVLRELRDERGRLLRTYNHGQAKIDAYLEDHAFLLEALIALFEASCEERWFGEAIALADEMIARFADPEHGGFFSTASDGEALIARRKDLEDTPDPLRRLERRARAAAPGRAHAARTSTSATPSRCSRSLREIAPRHPAAFGHVLQAMHWHLAPMRPIACPVPRPDGSARHPGRDQRIDR